MATTFIDSIIIAKATQEAWDQAIGLFNGDPIRTAEHIKRGLPSLAPRVSLLRTLAAQLDIESSPEAMRRRLETEKKVREAGASAIKAHGAKLADLAAKTGADLKAQAEAVQADIRRNGAHTAGM
jgi:hypothetical protein